MSLADEILATDDRPRVPVVAWGRTLYLQPMSGTERDSYDVELHRASEAGERMNNWRAKQLVRSLVNERGERIFTDEQAGELGKKNNATLRRLFEQTEAINATGPDAVETAAKNS